MNTITPRKHSIHVAYVIHLYEKCESPQALLNLHFTTMDWANALTKEGITVSVFYRFHKTDYFYQDNIHFYFIKDNLPLALKAYHLGYRFHSKVAAIVKEKKIDIIHAHNPYAVFPNWTLRQLAPQVPLIVQDHSGRMHFKYKWLLKKMLTGVDIVIFAAKGQEKTWTTHGILPEEKCCFVMENSSHFNFEKREAARKKTGLRGEPVFLWVGNLNKNKDPFTALAAFEKILKQLPQARLYMIYRFNDLEKEVLHFMQQHPVLIDKVKLLGAKQRSALEDYYNSADYLISASYKEGSGYALIEAMSCGVIPIVTNIPSFGSLTGNGTIGMLYEPGNPVMLYEKTIALSKQNITISSQKVMAYFQKNFSFEVIAKKTITIYHQLITEYANRI